jgi:hypothetical protein
MRGAVTLPVADRSKYPFVGMCASGNRNVIVLFNGPRTGVQIGGTDGYVGHRGPWAAEKFAPLPKGAIVTIAI